MYSLTGQTELLASMGIFMSNVFFFLLFLVKQFILNIKKTFPKQCTLFDKKTNQLTFLKKKSNIFMSYTNDDNSLHELRERRDGVSPPQKKKKQKKYRNDS